ncbi:MAG: hypothetical protein IKW90_09415, partial [Lachnospiraceae bacterium]|nr:hypothetical protein [Lachnospiraceae bacterium]
MKRGVFKSFVAVLLAVLLVVDTIPVQSISNLFNDTAVKAATGEKHTVIPTNDNNGVFVSKPSDFGEFTPGENGASGYYILESKNYYLNCDIVLDGYLYVPEGVTATILMALHHLRRELTDAIPDGYVIKVSGNLTMLDDKPGNSANEVVYGDGSIMGGKNSGNGGGVYVHGGTLNLCGFDLCYNTSEKNGGGAYIDNGGTFNMYGENLYGNIAENGGGVYVGDGTFNMYSRVLSSNSAINGDGGGVYISENGTFNMPVGTLTGNSASGKGGGVYVAGTFNASNNPTITGNSVGSGENAAENNVYLLSGKSINISDTLNGAAKIGLTMADPSANGGVFASDSKMSAGIASCFVSDNETYTVLCSGNNAKILEKDNSKHFHDTVLFTTPTSTMPTSSGTYYLTEDITLDSDWIVPEGGVDLCLNDHKIDLNGDHRIIVQNNTTFRLYDCGSTSHYYSTANSIVSSVVETLNQASLNDEKNVFTGGYITGGTSGAIYITNGSSFE